MDNMPGHPYLDPTIPPLAMVAVVRDPLMLSRKPMPILDTDMPDTDMVFPDTVMPLSEHHTIIWAKDRPMLKPME